VSRGWRLAAWKKLLPVAVIVLPSFQATAHVTEALQYRPRVAEG
jgi:hypothetical protein